VSKQDSQFFNMFSVVLGVLIAIAIGLFGYARSVGVPFESAREAADSMVAEQVTERIAPVGRVAVAGRDNRSLAIAATTPGGAGAAPALAVPKNGAETYQAVCSACHGAGVAGAPKFGDGGAWAARVAQGKATLYEHALKGYQGKAGVMPAKGGRADLPDALVQETVDYLVKSAQ
jgi:cytochrome c5